MNEIRLGTIGSGAIVHSILDNIQRTEGIRLAAVYSRSKEKGKSLAVEYGAEKVYIDPDSFFADDDVNCIYIATPNLLHYEQAKKALLAGKNVICEKPFCTRADQARELMALAKEKGLFLVDATPTAFLPNLKIMRRKLPEIGKVKLVMANYSQYSSRYDRLLSGELPNIFNPEYAGGCLMDINYYNVYLNIALFGRPLNARYHPYLFNGMIDTSGILTMSYDGFVSTSAGAKDSWGVNYFQIEGEQGYIYVPHGSNGLVRIKMVTKNGEEVFNEQPDPDRWFYEVQNMTRLLLAGDREAIEQRLETMLDVIETIEKARKEAGIFFPGDEIDEHPFI